MNDDLLDQAADVALARVAAAGGDPRAVGEPYRTVAVVSSAQPVLDNGGLRYLFENDWPGNPPYSIFCDAYRAVGAGPEVYAIERVVELLGLEQPERDAEARCHALNAVSEQIDELDGDCSSDVWELLRVFVTCNRDVFDEKSG